MLISATCGVGVLAYCERVCVGQQLLSYWPCLVRVQDADPVLPTVDRVRHQHVQRRHVVLSRWIDQFSEPVSRKPDVQSVHPGPVQVGRRVVGVGRDNGGPSVTWLLLVVVVGVVDGVEVPVSFDEQSVGERNERIANGVDIHVARSAQ